MDTPRNIVSKIFDDIKFYDFINNINDNNTVNLIRFISISGELNNDTYEMCTTENFIKENHKLEGEDITQYIMLCNMFREKIKEHNIMATPKGIHVIFSIRDV
jgi:hypothetical protein